MGRMVRASCGRRILGTVGLCGGGGEPGVRNGWSDLVGVRAFLGAFVGALVRALVCIAVTTGINQIDEDSRSALATRLT